MQQTSILLGDLLSRGTSHEELVQQPTYGSPDLGEKRKFSHFAILFLFSSVLFAFGANLLEIEDVTLLEKFMCRYLKAKS